MRPSVCAAARVQREFGECASVALKAPPFDRDPARAGLSAYGAYVKCPAGRDASPFRTPFSRIPLHLAGAPGYYPRC